MSASIHLTADLVKLANRSQEWYHEHSNEAIKNTDQGLAVKFNQPENKMSCAQREEIFVLGMAINVLGLGVLGLKYHVLWLKLVVSDQSNCS